MTRGENIAEAIRGKALEGAEFVTYGDGDLGIPMAIDEAIRDFEAMEEHQIGTVDYNVNGLFECNSEGRVL